MGSLGGLLKMIPGMNKIDDGMIKSGEDQQKIEAMISSMSVRKGISLNYWQHNHQTSEGCKW